MSEKLGMLGKLAASLQIIVEMTLIIRPSSGCTLSGKEVM